MKKTMFIIAILLSGFVFERATAQVSVGLSVNIGAQPVWGPVGYDHVDYYYMPDIDSYYYVPTHRYIYRERGHWLFAESLPYRYHNYNIYNGYKVVINEGHPYLRNHEYRARYASFRGNHGQSIIRNSHDQRYFSNRDHPEHNRWRNENYGHRNYGNYHQNNGRGDRDVNRGNNGRGHGDNGSNHGNNGGGHRDNGGNHENNGGGHGDNGGNHGGGNGNGHGHH